MEKWNKVFIARSLDGFIAGENGEIDWLDPQPKGAYSAVPQGEDMGYGKLMNEVDAVLMGRVTFEFIKDYDGPWPYSKPLYVLSNSLSDIPEKIQDKATIVKGSVPEVLEVIHGNGHLKLYVDGGAVIHSFLEHDLIDEMVITTVPVLVGKGIPLFRDLDQRINFHHVETKRYSDYYSQDRYVRRR